MSLIDTLDPALQPWAQALFDLAESAGVRPRVTSGRRSYASQEKLYKAFLAGNSKYPAAAPGSSAHEYGLAFDMVVEGDVNQRDLGVVWIRWRGRYGGEEDPIHFEHPGFRSPVTAGGPISATPPPTADSIEHTLQSLANDIVLGLPTPLRGILNTAEVLNALSSIAGANPYAYGVQWMLTHPAQLTQAFLNVAWNRLLGRS